MRDVEPSGPQSSLLSCTAILMPTPARSPWSTEFELAHFLICRSGSRSVGASPLPLLRAAIGPPGHHRAVPCLEAHDYDFHPREIKSRSSAPFWPAAGTSASACCNPTAHRARSSLFLLDGHLELVHPDLGIFSFSQKVEKKILPGLGVGRNSNSTSPSFPLCTTGNTGMATSCCVYSHSLTRSFELNAAGRRLEHLVAVRHLYLGFGWKIKVLGAGQVIAPLIGDLFRQLAPLSVGKLQDLVRRRQTVSDQESWRCGQAACRRSSADKIDGGCPQQDSVVPSPAAAVIGTFVAQVVARVPAPLGGGVQTISRGVV